MLYRAYGLSGMTVNLDWDKAYVLPLGAKGKGLKFSCALLDRDFKDGEVVHLRKSRISGLPSIEEFRGRGDPVGWLARIRASGKPQHKGYGTVSIPEAVSKKSRLIAYGKASYGDGEGSWVDVLITIPFKTVVKVDRVGMPTLYIVFGETDYYEFSRADSVEEFLNKHAGYFCGALVRKAGWEKTWKRAHLLD